MVADTVEAYENGELAKLLGIDTVEEKELWDGKPSELLSYFETVHGGKLNCTRTLEP